MLPDRLEDYVHEDNPVRVVDAFVEALDLGELGFEAANRAGGGRPAYHPAALLKIYIYGYLNRMGIRILAWEDRTSPSCLTALVR